MSSRPTILVLSQEAGGSLARSLSEPGQKVIEARTAAEAEGLVGRVALDVVVADLGASGREAFGLLHVLPERAPDLPMIAVSGHGGAATAAEAMRLGAFDVVEHDGEPGALRAAIARAAEHHGLRREVSRLRREVAAVRDRAPLLGRSEAMREMSRLVDEAAARTMPVLVVGATGTGKSFVARELHARSVRSSGPYVGICCEGTHETLLESQLFGHRRGSFAGAVHDHEGGFRAAAGGTLFIERVELLPLPLQARLVETIKTSRVTALGSSHPVETDVRLVAGSARDLTPMVRAGRFREDLFLALAAVVFKLPMLRERPEDIPFLAEAFAAEEAERFGVAPRRIDSDALAIILAHPWPGNVKELRAAIRHAFGRGLGDTLRAENLPPSVRAGARALLQRAPDRLPTLAEAEAELVALVLEDSSGNKTLAARRLGIDRKRLYRKIKRYGLLGPDDHDAELEAAGENEAE